MPLVFFVGGSLSYTRNSFECIQYRMPRRTLGFATQLLIHYAQYEGFLVWLSCEVKLSRSFFFFILPDNDMSL